MQGIQFNLDGHTERDSDDRTSSAAIARGTKYPARQDVLNGLSRGWI